MEALIQAQTQVLTGRERCFRPAVTEDHPFRPDRFDGGFQILAAR